MVANETVAAKTWATTAAAPMQTGQARMRVWGPTPHQTGGKTEGRRGGSSLRDPELEGNVLQMGLSDHTLKIWTGKGVASDQSVHVITASWTQN